MWGIPSRKPLAVLGSIEDVAEGPCKPPSTQALCVALFLAGGSSSEKSAIYHG